MMKPEAGAWTVDDLERDSSWIKPLSAAQIDELLAAVDTARASGKDSIYEVTREDFPLVETAACLAGVREELLDGRGISLIRGFPIERLDEEGHQLLIWGLGLHLGEAEPQDADGALLHHIRDTGQSVRGTDNVRGFQTNSALAWHNDGGDAFALYCLEQVGEGGTSYLVSARSIYNAIAASDPELLDVLRQPFYFDARSQQLEGQKHYQAVPIFSERDDHLFVLYKRGYIHLAQRFDDVPRLSEAQKAALDLFDSYCEDERFCYRFKLQPGDIELANNHTILHGRSAYEDPPDNPRHLLRLWMTLDGGPALPDVYRDTREFGLTWQRRHGDLETDIS